MFPPQDISTIACDSEGLFYHGCQKQLAQIRYMLFCMIQIYNLKAHAGNSIRTDP